MPDALEAVVARAFDSRDLRQALAEALAKIKALETALLDAGHYVACCPPPPEATGDLRISLLEERGRIAQAAQGAPASAPPTQEKER